jgi:hypothetical protein
LEELDISPIVIGKKYKLGFAPAWPFDMPQFVPAADFPNT